MDRRDFLGRALIALLEQTIASRRLLARGASRVLADWIRAHDDLAQKLHALSARAPLIEWQDSVRQYG